MERTHPKWEEITVDNFHGACHLGVGMVVLLEDESLLRTSIPPGRTFCPLSVVDDVDEEGADQRDDQECFE